MMQTNTIIAGAGIAAAAIAYFYMRSRRGKISKASTASSSKSEISP